MNTAQVKILVVDDRRANLLAMRELLYSLSVQVIEADSGHKALELLLEHDFALILLDVDMPGMDGYEVAEMAHRFNRTTHIPIIFLTAAFKDRRHRLQGYEVGAVDYLEKPFDERIFLSKVRIFIDLYQLRQAQEQTLSRLHQSEAKFRAMVDHVGVGIVRVDLQGVILEVNVTFCTMLGYASEELIGCSIAQISHSEDIALNQIELQKLLAGTIASFHAETRYFAKDGQCIWGSLTVTLISGKENDENFLLAAIENITQRKQQEMQLRQLSQAVEQSPVSIVITDLNGTIQYVNPTFSQVTGYSQEEALGHNSSLLKSGLTAKEEYEQLWQTIMSGHAWRGELFNKRKNGDYYWENALISPIFDSLGQISCFLGIKEDITGRKLAEKALHQSEMRFRMLAERAQDLIYRYRFDWPGFEYVSPAVTRLTGYTPAEFYADPQLGSKIIHPEDRHLLIQVEESFAQALVLRWICKDQTILWTEQRTTPYYDDFGKLLAIDGILRDITTRQQHEEALLALHRELHASETRLRAILDNSSAVIFIKDLTGRYQFVNRRYEELFHVKNHAMVAKSDDEIFPAEYAVQLQANDRLALASTGAIQVEERVPQDDGMHIYITSKFTLRDLDDRPYAVCGIATDITERKRAEISLQESEQQLQEITATLSEGLYVVGQDGLITFINPTALKLLGWCEEEVLGGSAHRLFHHAHRDGSPCRFEDTFLFDIMNVGKVISTETEWLWQRNGCSFPVALIAAPIIRNGEVRGVVVAFRDITERKQTELILAAAKVDAERANQYSRSLIEASLDPLVTINAEGKITDVNTATELVTGLVRDHLIGSYFADYFTKPDQARTVYKQVLLQGFVKDYPLAIRHVDGKITEVLYNASVYRDNTGYVLGVFAAARDITARNRAERLRQETEKELKQLEWLLKPKIFSMQVFTPVYGDITQYNTKRTILDALGHETLTTIVSEFMGMLSTSAVVFESNGDYATGMFSSGWCQLMDGASYQLCETDDAKQALSCGQWLCYISCWSEATKPAIETGMPNDIECQGGIRLYAVPIRIGDQIIGGISFGYGSPSTELDDLLVLSEKYQVGFDVLSQAAHEYKPRPQFVIDLAKSRLAEAANLIALLVARKQTEDALRHAKEQAEQAAKSKGEFLASMSHEIRTPMNVVLGMSELLLESDLNPTQLRFVQIMHHSGKALLGVINDILDFSRIEAGRISVAEIPFSPRQVVEETAHLMQIAVEEKGLVLEVEVQPTIPECILGDDGRVRQVLINLLGNAIKFTHHGKVRLGVMQHPIELGLLLFQVEDTGIGMDAEQIDHVFEQFIQADAGITRRYGGTGLGLTISKHLVTLMGGQIGVKSQMNQGSTFFFTLPVRMTTITRSLEPVVEPLSSTCTHGLHILLAEDVEENQVLFDAYLMQTPHEVIMVKDGLEAIAQVQENRFDVVIMDVQMPNMDGYTATRRIRQWEAQTNRSPVPIIALSAHAMEGEIERSQAAGCNLYMTKPIKKKVLLDMLQQVSTQSITLNAGER